jgi:cytoskeleton protein RodZ
MAQFGDQLRQQRLARGVSLSQIAADTRISARYLEALERHDIKQLPGAIFARSFARQYANYVGLDFARIEAEVAATFPSEDCLPAVESQPAKEGIQIKPLTEWLNLDAPAWRRLPRPLLTLGVVLLACSGVYWGWQRAILGVSGTDDGEVAGVSGLPPTKLPSDTSEMLPASPLATVSGANAETARAPEGTTSLELQAPPGSSAGVSVRVVATQETWVSITANGKRLFRGILQPNEARLLTGVEKATMIIGNAGGVDVQTDGRSIGPIGPPGQVRVVNLSPQGMEIKRQPTQSDSSGDGTTTGTT